MRHLLRRVPQLQRLAVLDAVATTGGFTSAAVDLGVSQPAVSRHIALLERHLGVELFERTPLGARLTPTGQRFADAVAEGLGRIERELLRLDDHLGGVLLAVQPAMATSWIVPNLDRIKEAAGCEIRLWIYDRTGELDRAAWDLVIRPGEGGWDGLTATELLTEAVQPLASPALADRLGLDSTTAAERLVGTPLLYIDDIERPSMTWRQWFDAVGCDSELVSPPVIYDSYPTVVQEALVGHGIMLGWRHLLGDLLERRLLVPVGRLVERPTVGQHVCWRTDHPDTTRLESIRDWLVGCFGMLDESPR